MREKYESLALADLKEIAKARGMKGTSTMKKAEVIEAMLLEDEKEKKGADVAERQAVPEKAPRGRRPAAKNAPDGRKTGEGAGRDNGGAGEKGRQGEERGQVERKSQIEGQEQIEGKKQAENREQAEGKSQIENRGQAEGKNQIENRRQAEGENQTENREQAEGKSQIENRGQAEGKGQIENRRQAEGKGQFESRNQGETRFSHEGRNQGEGRRGPNEGRTQQDGQFRRENRWDNMAKEEEKYPADLDSGITAHGILEVMPDGYGFIRCENYLPGENDVYVAPSQIRRFNLKTGDILEGNTRIKTQSEKFSALLYVKTINGYTPDVAMRRCNFEDMTPIFPNVRLNFETPGASVAMRIMDLISPVGKGQRGMIVSQPKAGKTTLLKEVAKSVKKNSPEVHLIILLIDERPEEVTDIKEAIEGPNVEVIYSTFDELPEHHKRVSEMVIERAKRLVEHKKDVMILLDSITRLTRAYNLTVPPSGRTLSGGLDPAALHMPKRFFGAARNMRGGGSLTILATALVETGSKMDDVVYEEFKGTGNMELVLDRKLSERRVFPAIDIPKSSTRREDLLLSPEEQEAINIMRKALNGLKPEEAVDKILDMFSKTRSNMEFVQIVKKIKFL